jgi:NADH-ubiquinone oxidoreductase chain 5
LVIPSVLIGFYAKDMIIGFGSDFWGNAIFVTVENMNRVDSEFIVHFYKILPVILSLLGVTSSFLLYVFGSKLLVKLKFSRLGKKIYNFFNKKWFFDKIYNEYISQYFFTVSYTITYKTIDRGIIEIFGPMGLSSIITKKALYISRLQTGYLYHYTFLILIGLTMILGLRQFWVLANNFVDFKIFILFFVLNFLLLNEKIFKNL